MARARFALLGLALAAAGCSGSRPPEELSGLWSAGPAACAAGVGVRFGGEAIEAVYDEQVETLFRRPHYEVLRDGEAFRVRIVYELPHVTGGARAAGAYGVLVLVRLPQGGIAPSQHAIVDGRSGAARLRISDDPAVRLLTLVPCGPHPWRETLRGRA